MKKAYTDAVVRRFEVAVKAHSLRFVSHHTPKELDQIEAEYKQTKTSILSMIDRLNSQPQKGQ